MKISENNPRAFIAKENKGVEGGINYSKKGEILKNRRLRYYGDTWQDPTSSSGRNHQLKNGGGARASASVITYSTHNVKQLRPKCRRNIVCKVSFGR